VHFRIAELLEHEDSVQRVDTAVLGIHVVGMVQALRDLGSQHPWTPLRVFVAHMKDVLGHVIEDSGMVVSMVVVLWCVLGRTLRDEPETKPQVLSPEFV
jgi:hypothetical protein